MPGSQPTSSTADALQVGGSLGLHVVPPALFLHILFPMPLSEPFPGLCIKNKPSNKVPEISALAHMGQNSFLKLSG